MAHDQIKRRLTPLRDEARALASAPSLIREQLDDWRKRTAAALAELYGADSTTSRDFRGIKFDDAEVVDAAERILREKAALSGRRIQLPPAEKALRSALYEAADLLTSLMICT